MRLVDGTRGVGHLPGPGFSVVLYLFAVWALSKFRRNWVASADLQTRHVSVAEIFVPVTFGH